MPKYICRFCNKFFCLTNDYYCHLHTHRITNKGELELEELELVDFYYTRRKSIKVKSYYKMKENKKNDKIEYKHKCSICDFKCQAIPNIKTHLIGKHTVTQLLENGYEKEYIDKLIEEKQKRKEYQKIYQLNSKKNCSLIPIPILYPVPQLIPLVYFIPLIKMD
jgi:hypothetical protein